MKLSIVIVNWNVEKDLVSAKKAAEKLDKVISGDAVVVAGIKAHGH